MSFVPCAGYQGPYCVLLQRELADKPNARSIGLQQVRDRETGIVLAVGHRKSGMRLAFFIEYCPWCAASLRAPLRLPGVKP